MNYWNGLKKLDFNTLKKQTNKCGKNVWKPDTIKILDMTYVQDWIH